MGKTKQKQFRTQQTLSGGTAPHRPGAPLATLTRFSLDGRFQPKHVHPGGRPQVSPHLLPTIRHKSSFQQSRLTEPAPDVFSHGELLPGALTTRRQGQSLLGPPPLGSSFRNLFTNPGAVHYLNSCGSLLTWGSASNTDEKKDSVQIIAGKCDEQTRKPNTDSGQGEGATNGQTHSVSEHPEPPFKQLCDNGLNEPGEESAERQTPQFQPTKTNAASSSDLEEKESSSAHLGEESVDQNRAAEVQGVGTSLKVTIQRSNESRAFNTSPEEMAAASAVHEKERGKHTDQFTCHICNSTCTDQHGFQTHMMSQDHQQRMMEIQRLGNNCLATFIPQSHESLPGTNREKTVNLQHWCPTCQCRFSGDVIEHRRTKKHKVTITHTDG